MQERFKLETQGLARSWMRYDREWLQNYLVGGVENPRINIQSVLTRHFLTKRLFGEQFADLMEQELRFALVVNWLLKLLEASVRAERLRVVLQYG